MIILLYCLVGLGAGFIAGLFGVGGGLLMVPLLVFLFQQQNVLPEVIVHLSIGTSLTIIIFTSSVSTWAHHQRGAVLWSLVWRLSPGLMLGACLGAVLAKALPSAQLSQIFGLFEISIALLMLLNRPLTLPDPQGSCHWLRLFSAGTGIGTLSAIVGIGGGSLTVPFLVSCRINMQKVIATAAACGLPIAIAGALSFWWVGGQVTGLPNGSSGYIYWPSVLGIGLFSIFAAPFGAKLAHRLSAQRLQYYFAYFLMLLGVHMLCLK